MKTQLGDICQISIKPFAGNAVGYAIYPSEGEDEEQIRVFADKRMYGDKESYKTENGWIQAGTDARSSGFFEWASQMKRKMEKMRFPGRNGCLFLQNGWNCGKISDGYVCVQKQSKPKKR